MVCAAIEARKRRRYLQSLTHFQTFVDKKIDDFDDTQSACSQQQTKVSTKIACRGNQVIFQFSLNRLFIITC